MFRTCLPIRPPGKSRPLSKALGPWLRPLAVVLLASLIAQACSFADPKTFKLAVVVPFSGRYYGAGSNVLSAVELAVAEWNGRGGAGGYRAQVVAQDDRNEAEGSALQAKKMAADPAVVGVVGHLSRVSIVAAAAEYRRAAMPALTLGGLPEALPRGYPSILGATASEGAIAREAARFISQGGFRNVALVAGESVSGEESQLIMEALAEYKVSAQETRLEIPADLRETAKHLLVTSPDLVFYPGPFVEGAGLLRELRGQGSQAAYFGGADHALPDFLSVAGDAAEGAYYVSPAPYPGGSGAAAGLFAERYQAKFGAAPTAWAAIAYDATNAMLDAVEQAVQSRGRPDRAAVGATLADAGGDRGLGTLEKGSRSEPRVYIYRIAGLKFPGELKWPAGVQ